MNTAEHSGDEDHLMVWVPRVSKPQSILNFFWGDGPLVSPK